MEYSTLTFYKGLQSELPTTREDNNFFITNDTGKIHLGSNIWYSKIQTKGTLFVNKQSEELTEDGSLYTPFKTIQAAINASTFGDTIIVYAGGYNENIIINNKQNLTITSDSTIGQYRVDITGSLTISSNSYRIGINNIQFSGDYINQSVTGLTYFDNVSIGGNTSFSGSGYHRYDFCFFKNINHIGTVFIDIRTSQCENNSSWTINNINGTLSIIDTTGIDITHTKGNIYIGGYTNFLPVSSNIALNSTANIGEGGIRFDGGTFLQANGTYAKINKIGTCPYSLANVVYEPTISILNGTKIDGGLHSDQIYDHYVRSGYTHSDGSLKTHLDGISNVLDTKVEEAPNDGKAYYRQNKMWVEANLNRFYIETNENGGKIPIGIDTTPNSGWININANVANIIQRVPNPYKDLNNPSDTVLKFIKGTTSASNGIKIEPAFFTGINNTLGINAIPIGIGVGQYRYIHVKIYKTFATKTTIGLEAGIGAPSVYVDLTAIPANMWVSCVFDFGTANGNYQRLLIIPENTTNLGTCYIDDIYLSNSLN